MQCTALHFAEVCVSRQTLLLFALFLLDAATAAAAAASGFPCLSAAAADSGDNFQLNKWLVFYARRTMGPNTSNRGLIGERIKWVALNI